MFHVQTVSGPIAPDALGHSQIHEHIFVHRTPMAEKNPALRLDDPARSLEELRAYRAAGGGFLADAQPVAAGRDAERLGALSRESGVAVAASTGYHLLGFYPADILLPKDADMTKWAVVACDQFTSQPEYWQRAEHLADGKPSTLHIVLPEAYLGTPQEAERLESIRRTMEEYRKSVLTRKVHGYVYVERTQMDGTVRQGLVGAVDLDAYDYAKGSKPAIRPSESTVVERIPPRLKVRRGATLETPHVMMLADDADCTLIEPIGLMKNQLPPLYDGELMLGGGHLRGWAVEDPALIAGIDAALAALAAS